MNLLSMTATFGCLENATLTLEEGLNLLELPNESGKSTWCAFLRAMFYGLDGRRGGAMSERNRYTPWSGAVMNGSVDLLWQGRAITLRRFAKGTNPFGGFQAVYTGTEEPVPGLTADNVGQTLLGVTKDAFQRTCFIPQGGLHMDASGDLERRIAALAGSGEEDVSYTDASQRLRVWRNRRQSNRSAGTLPRLREQLDLVRDSHRRLLDARRRGQEAAAQLQALDAQLDRVNADLALHAQAEAANQAARQRQHYEDVAQHLAQAEEDQAAALAAAAAALEKIPPQPGPVLRCRLPLIFGVATGLALVLAGVLLPLWPLIPAGAGAAAVGIGASLLLSRRHAAAKDAYGRAVSAHAAAQGAAQGAQAEYIMAHAAWEAISAQGEPPRPVPMDRLPRNSLTQDRATLRQLTQAQALCRDQLSRSKGEEEALGGPEAMEAELAALEADIAREEGELAALNLALEVLDSANAQVRSRFSPSLNGAAGDLLARLTGGRYEALTFTRTFEIMAQTGQGSKSAQLLSQGTADQAYLALRLAICDLALPWEDKPPLVLDDALVCFDDHRLALALELLSDLARDRQLLLFTCQSRERTALANSGRNDYNIANIS